MEANGNLHLSVSSPYYGDERFHSFRYGEGITESNPLDLPSGMFSSGYEQSMNSWMPENASLL